MSTGGRARAGGGRVRPACRGCRERPSICLPSSRENCLYYALKKYCDAPEGAALGRHQDEAEAAIGIQRMPAHDGLDIEIQAIEMRRLRPEWMDPRLHRPGMAALADSE